MNSLTVKSVSFNGSTIIAAQEKGTGKIYVGVRWVCEGLGLTEGQTKRERLCIQSDVVLSKGGRILVLPTKGGNQEVLCLELDFLPLWLAKISITPKMQGDQPELTQNLVRYQLDAKNVLSAAFINSTPHLPLMPPETLARMLSSAARYIGVHTRVMIHEGHSWHDVGKMAKDVAVASGLPYSPLLGTAPEGEQMRFDSFQ